jgi:hypothetical protein
MKRLFVIAFAVTSLLRPSLVLCVEATGDVRVEFQEATCCVSEHAVPDITFRAASAVDCDGCIDVGLATNSRLLKRVSYAPAAPVVTLFAVPLYRADAFAVPRTPTPVESLHIRVVSTTVIRR